MIEYIIPTIKVAFAGYIGVVFGSLVSIWVITGYGLMILSSFLNIYYACIFLFVGSYYSYRICKKNQIMLQFNSPSND